MLSSSGSIFQTAGDTKSLFICGLFSAVTNVAGILLGVFYFKRIEAVAHGLLVTFTINFIQTYWLMYVVIFKASIGAFLTCLWKPLIFAGILAVLLYGTDLFLIGITNFITCCLKASYFSPLLGCWFGLAVIKLILNNFSTGKI
ncbi:hypothetical protein OKW96_04260 [Sphingobacterium sp. KU25419]|nr:hypothetical protein OKW96_04260 [Sphingobacterium sp. KU25419]